jgi:hypothetical protein
MEWIQHGKLCSHLQFQPLLLLLQLSGKCGIQLRQLAPRFVFTQILLELLRQLYLELSYIQAGQVRFQLLQDLYLLQPQELIGFDLVRLFEPILVT